MYLNKSEFLENFYFNVTTTLTLNAFSHLLKSKFPYLLLNIFLIYDIFKIYTAINKMNDFTNVKNNVNNFKTSATAQKNYKSWQYLFFLKSEEKISNKETSLISFLLSVVENTNWLYFRSYLILGRLKEEYYIFEASKLKVFNGFMVC